MEGSISIALLASAAASAQKFKHQHKKNQSFHKIIIHKSCRTQHSYTPPHCTIDFKKQSVINEQRILFYIFSLFMINQFLA